MSIIGTSLLVLGITGLSAAIILYIVSQKFKVEEDERIDLVEEILPGANCGGCGSAGCRNFAERCIKVGNLDGLSCPVGGNETMKSIANILGIASTDIKKKIAIVKCNGECAVRPKTTTYNGSKSCKVINSLYVGENECSYGCLGCGDCTSACKFEAITINTETGLPHVSEDKCTGCGECTKACPRHIIELRPEGIKGRRIYVSCMNKDKGAVARKNCTNACIGCSKCLKECSFEAITIANNLAYIDAEKCRLCRKCFNACPTGAIKAVNFPAPKQQETQSLKTTKAE